MINHIYWFSAYNTKGISVRYRGLYILKALKKNHNISYTFIYPSYKAKALLKFLYTYLSVLFFRKKNSYIVFQKIHKTRAYAFALKLLLRIRNKNTVYDTDDADYLRYKPNSIDYFIKHSVYCTVGSRSLESYALKLNKNVFLNTTPVINHNEIKKTKNKLFHIGWVGNLGSKTSRIDPFSQKISLFDTLLPVLSNLDFVFKFSILGVVNSEDKQEILKRLKNSKNIIPDIPENINWLDEDGIYKRIKEFDVGLSAFIDHDFNIAKSAFKTKQYLSCGVPVIGNPVGENGIFITDAYNGYFFNSDLELKNRILEFYQMNNNKYNQFNKNALESRKNFKIDDYCIKFIKFITESSLSRSQNPI